MPIAQNLAIDNPQFKHIPVIDLSNPDLKVTAAAINKACSEIGFLQVINHGVTVRPESLLNFFHLASDETKINLSRGNGGSYRGYFPAVKSAASYKEGFEIGSIEKEAIIDEQVANKERKANSSQTKSSSARKLLLEPNRWPQGKIYSKWQDDMKNYYKQVQELGIQILNLAGISLGLEPDYFTPYFAGDKTLSTLRIIRYPVRDEPKDEGGLACSEHSDSGILTLLYQDEAGGLEALNGANEWIPIPPITGAYVINIGDLMSLWTGHRWKSTIHRVRQTGKERFSIPFFLEPCFDAIIKPLIPSLATTKFHQITYGPWLVDKITREFVEYQDLLLSNPDDETES